ncbi:MAG: PqqD family protein [Burkholderiales bacterium]|nr:PqqD family protein [Burkholderiales bacterium]
MRLAVSEEVVLRDLAGEAILLDMNTNTYFGLNAVGTRVWHLLAEHQSTETIIPLLLQEFEVKEHRFRLDLDRLVQQLLEKKLLIEIDKPA